MFPVAAPASARPGAPRRPRVRRPLDRTAAVVAVAVGLIGLPVRAQTSPGPALPASAGAPADSVTLSIADVQRLAFRQNLSLQAARQESAIAQGALRQARLYQFNPDLSLTAVDAESGEVGGTPQVALTQEIEVAGQRGLRIGAARVGVQRAAFSVQNAARLTLADASTAFYRAVAADRRLGVAQSIFALNERLLNAVRIQLRAGEISALDANLAEVEFGRSRARVLAERRAATNARLELQQLVGVEPGVPVRLVDDGRPLLARLAAPPVVATANTAGNTAVNTAAFPARALAPDTVSLDADSLVRVALERRPDLAASTATVAEAGALARAAGRERVPNLRLGVITGSGSRGIGGVGGTVAGGLGPVVGLTLPIFNRNQGLLAQRRAQVEQARLEREATALRVRTEVLSAARAYRTASQEASVFETSVLQPARANSALLDTAFRAGKIALPTLLLLRNQLLDAELGYYDTWLAQREALVQLAAATGGLGPAGAAATTTDSARTSR